MATSGLPACAEILGLEPPDGASGSGANGGQTNTGGTGNTTQAGGSGGGQAGSGGMAGNGGTGGGGGTGEPGEVAMAKVFPVNGIGDFRAITVAPNGEIYVAGTYETGGLLDNCPLPGTGSRAGFVAKFSPELKCIWAATIQSNASGLKLEQLTMFNGHVWAIGTGAESVQVLPAAGTGAATTMIGLDAIVVGFATDGSLVEAFRIGGAGDDYGRAITSGTNILALVESGLVQVGVQTLLNPGTPVEIDGSVGSYDGLVVSLTESAHSHHWKFGSTGADSVRSITMRSGLVVVGGGLQGPAVFDTNCTTGAAGRAFVADHDATGLSDKNTICDSFGGPGNSYTNALDAKNSGALAQAGTSEGEAKLGCLMGGTATTHAWLRLGQAGTGCVSAVVLSGPDHAAGQGVLLTNKGVLFGGVFSGPLDGYVSKMTDIFVRRYSDDLSTLLWHREFGGSGNDNFGGMAVSPIDGSVLVVGQCVDSDPPDILANCEKEGDGFILKLNP